MLRSIAARSFTREANLALVSQRGYSSAGFANISQKRGFLPPKSSHGRIKAAPSTITPRITSIFYSTKFDKIDHTSEKEVSNKKLKPHPAEVSTASSVTPVLEGRPSPDDVDMMAGVKADAKTIQETFALPEVPREPLVLGIAGILPYAATSLSTVALAYDINRAHRTGSSLLFDVDTSHYLLDLITPIQVGYGAVIISFLGAIHWGLEYAGYGGRHGYYRYMYGVIAPAVAWPTMYMPVEYALITQFMTFNFLYFADARATVKGWFPPWYSTYRFVLTFFVGASIVISLIGRSRIAENDAAVRRPAEYLRPVKHNYYETLEIEEKEERAALKAMGEEKEGDSEKKDKDEEDDNAGKSKGEGEKDDESKDDKKDKEDNTDSGKGVDKQKADEPDNKKADGKKPDNTKKDDKKEPENDKAGDKGNAIEKK